MDTYEARAAQKLHAATPAEGRGGIRPMEAVWFLIAAVLFLTHLESTDVSTFVVAERQNECQLAKERAAQYAVALTHLLNQTPVLIGETTRVSCRVKEVQS